ncbi:hypothetical protein Cni_G20851 [Canna indica]|uniref:HMA domain-containing protein n=1 Tax=Canna indica TaxID=4628 RepID=A0AAQ3KNG3_9LILI|nr:hypothetical protein Cni_G20851 [Canna indica]
MKQKIVIKVQISCKKCRIKAMKLVASAEGVDSVAVEGENKDQLVIVGDGVDPACLTHTLRKKVGHADIIKVEEVKIAKQEEKKPNAGPPKPVVHWYPNYPPCPQLVYYDDYYACRSSNSDNCSIM